jgi:phosphoglycerate dehydrogenase-like enzyme
MGHAAHPVILLLEEVDEDQKARVREAAPGAELLSTARLEADPAVMERVDICYGVLPGKHWARAGKLRWLQSPWAGVDGVLRDAGAQAHPAVITNVHIHAEPVAEHLWGMALMLTRNLHRAAAAQTRREWDREPLTRGLSSLAGRTLCVAGLGAIGRRCALIGRAFGMRVIGIRRSAGPAAEADEVVGPGDRRNAFSRSRLIIAVLPETAETGRFIGREDLAVMRGAFLLNGGRGSAVDTEALTEALRDGRVRGAGLDVTDPEPLPAGHPLWDMPNVIITPHYAGTHPGYAGRAFQVFAANLERFLRGQPLVNVVDRERGY